MYCIILIHAERSVFDSLNDRPSVFTTYLCGHDRKRLTFDTIDAVEVYATAFASEREGYKYMRLSPSLDIIEHARDNEGTTFVQIDFVK